MLRVLALSVYYCIARILCLVDADATGSSAMKAGVIITVKKYRHANARGCTHRALHRVGERKGAMQRIIVVLFQKFLSSPSGE